MITSVSSSRQVATPLLEFSARCGATWALAGRGGVDADQSEALKHPFGCPPLRCLVFRTCPCHAFCLFCPSLVLRCLSSCSAFSYFWGFLFRRPSSVPSSSHARRSCRGPSRARARAMSRGLAEHSGCSSASSPGADVLLGHALCVGREQRASPCNPTSCLQCTTRRASHPSHPAPWQRRRPPEGIAGAFGDRCSSTGTAHAATHPCHLRWRVELFRLCSPDTFGHLIVFGGFLSLCSRDLCEASVVAHSCMPSPQTQPREARLS